LSSVSVSFKKIETKRTSRKQVYTSSSLPPQKEADSAPKKENDFSEPSSIFQERAVIFREGTLKFTNIPEKQTQVFEDHVPFF